MISSDWLWIFVHEADAKSVAMEIKIPLRFPRAGMIEKRCLFPATNSD